jgi:hypothetical protein
MKRWHVLVISIVALTWMATGAFWMFRESRQAEEQQRIAANRSRQFPDGEQRNWRLASDKERKEATASIMSQLTAFKKDDFQKAADFQSSSLRQMFRASGDFRNMIKTRYPAFCNYKKVTFGQAHSTGKDNPSVIVRIQLTGVNDEIVEATYRMIKEQGKYRVDSVRGGFSGRGFPTGPPGSVGPPGSNGPLPGGSPGSPFPGRPAAPSIPAEPGPPPVAA